MTSETINQKLFEIFEKRFAVMWKHKYPHIGHMDYKLSSYSYVLKEFTKDWHVYVCSLGAHLIRNQNLPSDCGPQKSCGYETAETRYIPDPASIRGMDDIDYIILDAELSEKILALFESPV